MNNSIIEAQAIEINNGPYFNVTLRAVPRVGEFINLYSLVDQAANYPPEKYYEVVWIVHRLFDVPENISKDSREAMVAGSHSVEVFVKPSTIHS